MCDAKPGVSIVIPALNEARGIRQTLLALQTGRGQSHEIIVVDGGSTDGTRDLCGPLADIVAQSVPGRARQMNAGALLASNKVYWFVHADTVVPEKAVTLVQQAIENSTKKNTCVWGRFNVRFDNESVVFQVLAWFMNRRSCITGIATGDQGIFVTRKVFEALGGYPDQPLMEDIELSRHLKKISSPACIQMPVVTSCRRWQENGTGKTVLLMWKLRLLYFFGVSAEKIAEHYRGNNNK